MEIPFRPLGKAMNIVASTGLDVTYVYDDLVFADNSVFILQFDNKDPDRMLLHFNADCDEVTREKLTGIITEASNKENVAITYAGNFSMKENQKSEKIEIVFDVIN